MRFTKRPFTAVFLAAILLVTLTQSGAHAASSKLNASQCKQAISSFQGLYGDPNLSGFPPLSKSEFTARRNIWKSLESKLSKGSIKSYFQDLISQSFVMLNTPNSGSTQYSGSTQLDRGIYEITKSCVPGETNAFCKTLPSALQSVINLSNGQSISKSGVLNTRKIWSAEVKKWPAGSNSKAWLNRLLINLDEMISEAKAKRDLSGVSAVFLEEWQELDKVDSVLDFWPCRDLVSEALGIYLDDEWNG
jgi:hypothetical protein